MSRHAQIVGPCTTLLDATGPSVEEPQSGQHNSECSTICRQDNSLLVFWWSTLSRYSNADTALNLASSDMGAGIYKA
eukprot:2427176-Rhodomonas_salina.1